MTSERTEFAALALSTQSFAVIPGALSKQEAYGLASYIRSLPAERWVNGDDSPHGWAETRVQDHEIDLLLAQFNVLTVLPKKASRVVAWLNRFTFNQWIDAHKDAGGDLQIIVGVEIPPYSSGGQLWLRHTDNLIPFGTGDVLLFYAANTSHGTTPITSQRAERITFNARVWF